MPRLSSRRLLILAIAVSSCLLAWHFIDKPFLITAACEVGLGNRSLPVELDEKDVGCVALGPKRRYSGIYIRGFEASNFQSQEFDPVKGWQNENQTSSWFHCPTKGCGDALEQQLSINPFEACRSTRWRGTRMASIEVEGWTTISAGSGYGHLNQYPREFFAARIVSVGPPPKKLIDERIKAYRARDMCDVPPQ